MAKKSVQRKVCEKSIKNWPEDDRPINIRWCYQSGVVATGK